MKLVNPNHVNSIMSILLPSFPLNLVVYPGEKLRLHIFEMRYRQLIRECLDTASSFIIPTVLDDNLAEFATEVRILSLDKDFPSGEMNITTEGIGRVRIREFQMVANGKLYPSSVIERLETEQMSDSALQLAVFELARELHMLLDIEGKLPDHPELLSSYALGHHVGLNLKQEYLLLTLYSEKERLTFLKDHLTKTLPVVVETERLRAKARSNGHFKNLLPPKF